MSSSIVTEHTSRINVVRAYSLHYADQKYHQCSLVFSIDWIAGFIHEDDRSRAHTRDLDDGVFAFRTVEVYGPRGVLHIATRIQGHAVIFVQNGSCAGPPGPFDHRYKPVVRVKMWRTDSAWREPGTYDVKLFALGVPFDWGFPSMIANVIPGSNSCQTNSSGSSQTNPASSRSA